MSEELGHAERPGLRLVVQGTDEAFSLLEEPVTIGSRADSTIVLTDPEVAALHATITFDPNPANEGQEGEGVIAIRNAGATVYEENEGRISERSGGPPAGLSTCS
jgi:hypothetical protein